jgi:hypothetical protein
MATHEHAPVMTEELHYCTVHPDRETSLQCNKCGRYMCVQCAVSTPVGYRCRECVRGIEDKFFNAGPADLPIAFGVSLVLNAVAGFIVGQIGFLLLALLLAAPIGGGIAEVALRAVGRRRGRQTPYVAAAGAAIGGLAPLLVIFFLTGRIVPNLSILLYAAITTAAVYARFRMRI